MNRKILKVTILLFVIMFFTIITNYYFSDKNIDLLKKNRDTYDKVIFNSISKLPVLKNNTNDVITFSSNLKKNDQNKYRRSFWELFK